MLDQVLAAFDIRPDFDLDVMAANQSLAALTSRVLTGVSDVLTAWTPDLVVVHGDTSTTLAASLAAYYARVGVAHVEAGLRTHDLYSPWPEEMNRKLTAGIATVHFAPTQQASQNLLAEGVKPDRIIVTGNTVIDALLLASGRLESDASLAAGVEAEFHWLDPNRRLILVTGHRRESFGDGLQRICTALAQLASRGDVQIVYPVHLNPNVREPVMRILGDLEGIHLIEPQDYVPFVFLLRRAYLVLTDSGGIQEEAPALGKPVLVMRDTTERPEALQAGTARLVGTSSSDIVANATELLDNRSAYQAMACAANPFGDGHASQRIIDWIAQSY